MPITVLTAPQITPVSVDEVRDLTRHGQEEDAHVRRLIEGAVAALLQRGSVCLTTLLRYRSEADYGAPRWPYYPRTPTLPRPLVSVETVTVSDRDGDTVLTVEDDYRYGAGTFSLYRTPVWGETLTVDFTAGYGDEPEDVPADLRLGLMRAVADLYAAPESYVIGTVVTKVPLNDLLFPYYQISV